MLNTLKRKKASTSSTKSAAKKVRRGPSKSAKTIDGQGSVDSTSFELQHLIDRPYYEYDSSKDDIGIRSC